MARLLDMPAGLGMTDLQFLSGPRVINATTTETLSAFVQTTASPFDALSFQVSFQPMQGALARRHRGWIRALHGGANATRFRLPDPDRMKPAEAGIAGEFGGRPWTNGKPWSNGQSWRASYPVVAVASSAVVGGSVVSLADSFWGHSLDIGDRFGFLPFHLGFYEVTEVIQPGKYRIWPPLRAAIDTDGYATLDPVLAVRLVGLDAASLQRDAQAAQNMTASFVEVFDYDVRTYFAD